MPLTDASPAILVDPPFDFRSERFERDASALASEVGAALEDCRQALFLAEGAMALARELLVRGYDALEHTSTLH